MICACALALVPGACPQAADYDYINIREPFSQKIPMAIPVFKTLSRGAAEKQVAQNAADMLEAALAYTGYFKMIDRDAFLQDPGGQGIVMEEIKFGNWTDIGAELLLTGGVRLESGVLQMEFRLFDPYRQKMILGKRYTGKVDGQRKMVLRFCGEMIKRLTGRQGLFDSRIAFVGTGDEGKSVYVCDFDGKNVTRTTKPQSIVVSPAWAPDNRYIAYTAYTHGNQRIYISDLQDGSVREFAAYEGINLTPAWHPGSSALAATLSFEGDEEIYLLTETGKIDKRLTESWGVDVSPAFSPEGKKMVFVSSRSGSPQLYVKDMRSGSVRRLTYEGTYNTQPDWSPVGGQVVYSGMKNGRIDIYVIDVDSGETERLTRKAGDNEAPSWSPDGSMIVFTSTRTGNSRIFVMTASGTDQRMLLDMPGKQQLPDWSPPKRE
ncbi:MAG: Tol-Pal system beta propeller repeat protein TolB [Desulfobacterales bacterium]|nr:Tol-Pal system beta propeller repeat protein TolB [Desulfobacterales bacterium]